MKIVLVTSDNREVCREYGRSEPEFGTAPEALMQGFANLGDEVEVHVVSCTQRMMRAPEKLARNIHFHLLPVPKIGWLRTGYQGCIRAVRRKVRELRPDIVHGQGTERDCGISAAYSGVPNVITVHGNMRMIARLNHARPLTFLWCSALLEGLTLSRTNGVVCITRYTREAVQPPARQTWLFPNAVDQRFFEVRPDPHARGKRTLLFVGTITERKNQNNFIRALDRIQRPEGFEVLFYGRADTADPYAQEFLELIKARPWCRFCDFADRDAIRNAFATASALVLPSLEDNCPMVVLEAMAAGVPVAASAVGGTPELIANGKTGVLFDPLDLDAMSAAVLRLLDGSALTAAAREDALARFHPTVIARKHLEVYREVVAGRR